MGTDAPTVAPTKAGGLSRDEGPSRTSAGGGDLPRSTSSSSLGRIAAGAAAAESSSLAASTAEKEVYEYIPDATALSAVAPQEAQPSSSRLPAVSSIAARPARAKGCDVDEQSMPPGAAFETFRGKTYETTQLRDELSHSARGRGRAGEARVFSADGGASRSPPACLFELGNRGFETPLGRLQRLRMEVEEMLSFVSSYPGREGVHAEAATELLGAGESAESEAIAGESMTPLKTRPQDQIKEALIFGQDPQHLLAELGHLRLQILSVMNDPSLQQLFVGVEPTTGRQSGGELLLKHLQEVEGSLDALHSTTSTRAPGSGQAPQPTTEGVLRPASPPRQGTSDTAAGAHGGAALAGVAAGGATRLQAGQMTQFDIYCVPSFTPLLECSRAAALESRLAQVEMRIGMSKISLLPFPDLQHGIMHISQKLALLDANKVEQLHKRTQRLLHELHTLQHRRREVDISGASAQLLETGKSPHTRGVAGDGAGYEGTQREAAGFRAAAADDQRVEELFDICERWKVKAAALPSVVERLKALKALHREAGGISVRLQVLEEQQAQLQSVVDSAEQNLQGLQKTVAETVAWAKATVQTMQLRLQRIDPSLKEDVEATKA